MCHDLRSYYVMSETRHPKCNHQAGMKKKTVHLFGISGFTKSINQSLYFWLKSREDAVGKCFRLTADFACLGLAEDMHLCGIYDLNVYAKLIIFQYSAKGLQEEM